jgi:hypothetical protein
LNWPNGGGNQPGVDSLQPWWGLEFVGRAGSPLPAARTNANPGAHGVTRPTATERAAAGTAALRCFNGRGRETGKNWLPQPATGWMPQFALFACAKRGQPRVPMRMV